MGCLFGCFRVAGGEPRGGRAQAQLVSSSLVPATNPKVDERRRRLPSRNALSAVFLREDEGSRVEQATNSETNQNAERKRMDQELKHETGFLKNCGALLETPNEIRKGPESTNSVYQSATHLASLPALSDKVHFMEELRADDCQTPSGSHQSSNLPDAMSSSWKGCDSSSQHDSEAVSKTKDVEGVNIESLVDCGIELTTLDSSSSPFSTPSKVNDKIDNTANTHEPDLEELSHENNIASSCVHHVDEALNHVEGFKNCGASRENSCQPDTPDDDFKCTKDDNVVSVELSISNECSLFQSSEDSVSSSACNMLRDNMNTTFVENCLATEVIVHASRKKVNKNSNSDVEFPSLSQWLKPPNRKKVIKDEAFTSDISHSAKSSEEDRPIVGMVAAHWRNKEPDNFTSKWWDGNGIPNSTNKYKEDQKVSWHATPFEERLEKALSDEKLLSQRTCPTGNTSQFSGVEAEESDTAASNHLYVAAFT